MCYCYYFLSFDTIHTCSFGSFLPNTGCKHLDIPFLLCAIHAYQNSIIVLKSCLLILAPAYNFLYKLEIKEVNYLLPELISYTGT